MALSISHTTPADGTFSTKGATEWNRSHSVSGASQYGVLYAATTTSIDQAAGFTFGGSDAGTGLQWAAGTAVAASVPALSFTQTRNFNTSATDYVKMAFTQTSIHASDQAFAIYGGAAGATFLLGVNATTGGANSAKGFWAQFTGAGDRSVGFQNNGGSYEVGTFVGADLRLICDSATKATLYNTAGRGFEVAAGAATTDVNAGAWAQTWNNAGVAFTGLKASITSTASAAGSLVMDLQVGGSSMFSVRKDGLVTTGGTAGVASFGPAAVASITVKNGIITAIS